VKTCPAGHSPQPGVSTGARGRRCALAILAARHTASLITLGPTAAGNALSSPAVQAGSLIGPGPDGLPAGPPGHPPGLLACIRQSRAIQVIMVVAIAANLANGGLLEVALPALAHAHWGAGGYGALLACLAGGAVIGTLIAARSGALPNPAMILVRHIGTTPFFPITGIFLAIAVLGGNTQRAFRDFGRQPAPSQRESQPA
jgi:hypothetical protein